MKNITLSLSTSNLDVAYSRALLGVSTRRKMRWIAPTNAPLTGEVRPQAADVRTTHLGGGDKDGVLVRAWSPPV